MFRNILYSIKSVVLTNVFLFTFLLIFSLGIPSPLYYIQFKFFNHNKTFYSNIIWFHRSMFLILWPTGVFNRISVLIPKTIFPFRPLYSFRISDIDLNIRNSISMENSKLTNNEKIYFFFFIYEYSNVFNLRKLLFFVK